MEGRRPAGLWLRADGCRNGLVWVAVDSSRGGAIFLALRWKSFARSRALGPEHLLHFRFDEETMLYVRFFWGSRCRLDCFAESSSDSGIDTSTDDEDDDIFCGAKLEGNDSG
ncbi:hypothetical protein ZWY2020_028918 [Hordeum vulgare]|nr:hypothetical protein ZWY2020_028918 [Hordeum vulgare]